MTSSCPECGRSVAETCNRPLMRDEPGRCCQLGSWLGGLWWCSLAAGIGGTLLVLAATLFGGLSAGRSVAVLTLVAAGGSLLAAIIAMIGSFAAVAHASVCARRALIATILTAFLVSTVVACLLAADYGIGIARSSAETLLKASLIPIAVSSFAMFVFGSQTLAWIASRTDRFVLKPQTNRFAFLTMVWHGVVLVDVLILSLFVLFDGAGQLGDAIAYPLIAAWFFSWFGHAGWLIYAMVTIARVRSAVRAEVKACRPDVKRVKAVPSAGEPA